MDTLLTWRQISWDSSIQLKAEAVHFLVLLHFVSSFCAPFGCFAGLNSVLIILRSLHVCCSFLLPRLRGKCKELFSCQLRKTIKNEFILAKLSYGVVVCFMGSMFVGALPLRF